MSGPPRLLGRRVPFSMLVGLALIAAFMLAGFAGPHLLSGDPLAVHADATLLSPSLHHPFGTDNFGRDVFLRVIFAAPLDLQMGLFLMLPGLIIGSLLGSFMGYRGGLVDTVLMRFIDVLTAFPGLVVLLAFIAFLGPGLSTMYIAGALFSWTSYARLVRGQMLVERQLDYVSAARVLGFGNRRILVRHLLPNVLVQSLVYAPSGFVQGVAMGCGLSYLGFGMQPPTPEWGVMIFEGQVFLLEAPWISGFAGLTIIAVAGAFTLLGDGLGDFLRPEIAE